ncbi:MAG: glycosyltransferase family 4 protein [Deltaproteobacteria bacterium]|nr:glycosyltransferase family 4 protein [Deltaproteobacteria bacterium]
MTHAIKFIFGSVPKDGGTYTFYWTLRPQLLKYGIDMRCVSVGQKEARLWDNNFADEGCVCLAEKTENVKKQAAIFVDWCKGQNVDIVFGINSIAILSALPYLPGNIRVMSRCANSFDHGYKITVSCYERLAGIIAQTPRQIHDLSENYGVAKDKLNLIPNGIEIAKFQDAASKPRGEGSTLRLGFLGRLEHNQKGVLFLPGIIRKLHEQGVQFHLKVAGKGVHGKSLESELRVYVQEGTVEFIGSLSPSHVPEFLAGIDVLLFPSQFEGCPNVLLEAMMAGCVPVASLLEGITDFILQEGKSGFLCPVGDCEAFAVRVFELAKNREKLREMSQTVAKDARERFSQTRMAADYARVLKKIMADMAEAPP